MTGTSVKPELRAPPRAAVARNDVAVLADQDRVGEAECPDAAGDLGDLGSLWVRALRGEGTSRSIGQNSSRSRSDFGAKLCPVALPCSSQSLSGLPTPPPPWISRQFFRAERMDSVWTTWQQWTSDEIDLSLAAPTKKCFAQFCAGIFVLGSPVRDRRPADI